MLTLIDANSIFGLFLILISSLFPVLVCPACTIGLIMLDLTLQKTRVGKKFQRSPSIYKEGHGGMDG